MTQLSDFVVDIETNAAKAFDKWVEGMDSYHSCPQPMKDAFRLFFMGGYLKGSSAGADATFQSTLRILGKQENTKETATT